MTRGPSFNEPGLGEVPEPLSVEDLLLQWVNRTLTVEGAKAIRDAARAAAPPDIDVLTKVLSYFGYDVPYDRASNIAREYHRLASLDATRETKR